MALFSTLVALSFFCLGVESRWNPVLRMPSGGGGGVEGGAVGTKWAVLIAGSHGFGNYRHQADVCHAYHTMRRGGLKDENIIVFMYDDIAYNQENPRPGVIINSPNGENVYKDVPKDYVGNDVNVHNFLAVLLGDKSALTGGSGKVVDSGPNDHIFIFYSDHGGPGVLGMPTSPHLYAKDLIDTLKKKHARGSYRSLVFYLEACESGSIFEGLLPQGLNIYATTAANAEESSWGTYCPDDLVGPPEGYDTCLGDLYSVSWLEDSDAHNLQTETLSQQYRIVKERTSVNGTYGYGSHAMQFGDLELSEEKHISLFMGTNPKNMNFTFTESNPLPSVSSAVNQRDADLLYTWHKYKKAPEGSPKKFNAQKDLIDVMSHRYHVDNSMELIGKLLFGSINGGKILKAVRPPGQPIVDDWDCLKSMVRTFETHCGSLSQYGMKHMRSIANICNVGVKRETMAEVAAQACVNVPSSRWSSIEGGFSA